MSDDELNLLKKLLEKNRILFGDGQKENDLFSFFLSLSLDEKAEVFKAKQGLFKPLLSEAKKHWSDGPIPSHVTDRASFITAIDMARRPSHYKNRKLDAQMMPDFCEAIIASRRRKRKHSKKDFIIENFDDKIKKWIQEGIGWRTMAKAINASGAGVTVSHVTISRIYAQNKIDENKLRVSLEKQEKELKIFDEEYLE